MGKETIDHSQIIEILEPGTQEEQASQEERVRQKFWPTFKKAMVQLPFAEDVVAAYYCALDQQTPAHAKGILLASLAYFVLPVDVIPDFIAAIGFTDDIAVLTTAFATLKSHMTDAQRDAARKSIEEILSQDNNDKAP